MTKQAPKVYCYDCGKYVGRRWGDKKVYRCSACLRKILPDSKDKKNGDDIPF